MDGLAATVLRGLPQLQRLLETPAAAHLAGEFGRPAVVAALRTVLAGLRTELLDANGTMAAPDAGSIVARASAALAAARLPGLRRVINATGIILHTNLGRAPRTRGGRGRGGGRPRLLQP
jgi:L-seryl-tRNA(Ser) seleniumtransferase